MLPLTLQVQNARTIEAPSWERVERAFARWDTLSRGFFILIDSAGNYVQTAGASYKAVVEFREVRDDGSSSHCVLGHPGGSTKPISIYSSLGTIELKENEIFALSEILEIFRSFYDHRTIPDRFVRRDGPAYFSSPSSG
jgi:hypothetical protein